MVVDSSTGMVWDPTVDCQSKTLDTWMDMVAHTTNHNRPNHFITVKMTSGSVIENLHIVNWPAHGFNFGNSKDLTIRNIFMDNRAGDVPNERSGVKAAAHNSDGFGIGARSSNIVLTDSTVYNQDDCVAVTSADNVLVSNMYCSGSHGLSIGSIG